MSVSSVVTFDLFSALIDSRSGGSAALGRLATVRGWAVSGIELYDRWDVANKAAQRDCRSWVPYVELARTALTRVYADLELEADAAADVCALVDSVTDWPLWPDVAEGLGELARRYRIGLLSNVDGEVFSRTRAAPFLDPELVMTSERLGVYKPDRRIYERARDRLGNLVHVATSGRDVRGALEAGIPTIRLRRSGHRLDRDGPRPKLEVEHLAELDSVLQRLAM